MFSKRLKRDAVGRVEGLRAVLWSTVFLLAGCGAGGQLPSLILVSPGSKVDVDVSSLFSHVPGTSILNVSLAPQAHGLAVVGSRVTGVFADVGAVRVSVTATNQQGGVVTRVFSIAAPAPEPGSPRLPAASDVYDDFRLDLPRAYAESRSAGAPFWDTTPESNPTTDAGATLGRVLFYDRRLSSTNTHSCGSCHQQQYGFADPKPLSLGVTGEPTRRNAMGLANVRYNLRNRYFADGRARTLEALVLMPIQDHLELANTLPNVVSKLRATDFYAPLFQRAFGTAEINAERISRALAQFLRSLISYRARADTAYPEPEGKYFPLPSPEFTVVENEGLALLIEGNCLHCHVDRVLTMVDPSNNGLDLESVDPGQGGATFRATSLRNIRRTSPYMHDGRFATLREVIDHYDQGIKPAPLLSPLLRKLNSDQPRRLNLTEKQKQALEAALDTLTDDAMLEDPKFSDPFSHGR
jgi:cytochrome c peroxidase